LALAGRLVVGPHDEEQPVDVECSRQASEFQLQQP
jgi:hypothetical protein